MIICFDHKNMIMPTHTPSISYNKQLLTYRHIQGAQVTAASTSTVGYPRDPKIGGHFRTKFWNRIEIHET